MNRETGSGQKEGEVDRESKRQGGEKERREEEKGQWLLTLLRQVTMCDMSIHGRPFSSTAWNT